MNYLITKEELKKALIEKLVKDFRHKAFSFFTDEMNRVFIEQTEVIKSDYYFIQIAKLSAYEDKLFFLEDNKSYEEAYKKVYHAIENEFRFRNNFNKKSKIDLNITDDKTEIKIDNPWENYEEDTQTNVEVENPWEKELEDTTKAWNGYKKLMDLDPFS